MSTPEFVQWFREAAPYIHAFRGRTFVIAFGGEVISQGKFAGLSYDLNLLVTLEARDRDPLTRFVLDKRADGSTALTPAMRMAFLMNAQRIVLLSDGLGNVGASGGALLRDAREAVRGGVRIDTIGLGADQDRYLLHALAAESGGLYQAL